MRQCPSCKTAYTDDSLKFCLSDGTALVDVAGEDPTIVRGGASNPLRVDFSSDPKTTVSASPPPSRNGSSSNWIKIVIAVVVIGLVAIGGLGLLGAAVYFGTSGKDPQPTPKPSSPTPMPTAASDPENERLKDEIANIQRQLEEQKRNANIRKDQDDDDQRGSAITATVNSPKDGFLALRNAPDADRGVRLAKIPHGAEVEIQNCEKTAVTIDSRSGRWCQVDYNGQTGWVFDAWLDY